MTIGHDGPGSPALASMPRVFITGLGFVTSIGNDAATVAGNLRDMRHGFELYPPFQKPEIACKVIGTIKGFFTDSADPEDWTWPAGYDIKRETIRSMAPHGLYAHCAFLQAIADAKLGEEDISNRDTGLFAASGGSPMLTYYHHDRMLKLGPARCSPLGIVASIVGTLNFNLVAAFKIQGASCGFSSACASSAHAMAYAFEEISLGRQKRMFVVGGRGRQPGRHPALCRACARSRCRPTRRWPRGPLMWRATALSEPAAGVVVVLESEDEVARRGVTPYCELAGLGPGLRRLQCGDLPSRRHRVRGSRWRTPLRRRGIGPGEVDYVNAHATSTLIGDISEARALRSVFGEMGVRPAVSSTKALTGHGLSLAGRDGVGILRARYAARVHPGLGPHHEPRPRLRGPEHHPRHA